MDPASAGTGSPPGTSRLVIIGSLLFLVMAAALVFLPGLFVQPSPEKDRGVTPAPPSTAITMTPAVALPATQTAGPRITTTRPTTASITLPATPHPTTMPEPGGTASPSGTPGFTVTITPAHATAARGETVVYRMLIEPQNGFAGKIHMEVTASFLFLSQTQDLGYQEPPYPKTIEYPFTVPDTLVPGMTVNGVVRSSGDGITREDHLSLTVK